MIQAINWTDGSRRKQISAGMGKAWAAMDLAYHKSQSNEDLLRNVLAVQKSLNDVLRHLIDNEYSSRFVKERR